MKLLVVSQWFPFPPVNGARQRVYHLVKGLSGRHEVHLLSFTQPSTDADHLRQIARICAQVRLAEGRHYHPTGANALRALFSTRPRSHLDRWSSEMAELVRDSVQRDSFDAAIAFTTLAADYIVSHSMPRVLDNDNVDTAYFARLVELADNKLTKFRRKLTWVKVAMHERRLASSFDATVAVSEEDKKALESLCPEARDRGAVHVVANGVDLGLVDYKTSEVDPRRLISTGALTYQANLDAAIFFCEQILPRIGAAIPDVQFCVTGGHEGVNVAPLVTAGATLTGFLPDIRPAVSGSAALVVPLRIGGGTRLKILEAMALGTPVVSTGLGAMGLGLRHEETALIADDPGEFAECTVRIMRDAELRRRISRNAREYVISNFGWERSVEALDKVLLIAARR